MSNKATIKVVVLYLIIFFILGSAVGSFLNVVIDRTTRGETIMGRSYCDYCKAQLGTFDLVPLLSFAVLRAKCRYCKKPLSWQYPIVETITAILFAVSFWYLAESGNFDLITSFYILFLVSTVVVVAVVDWKFSLIPTTFVFAAAIVSLFYNYFFLSSAVFIENIMAAFGAGLFFLIIVVATRGRGMGQGDIVLAFLMGIVLGIRGVLVAVFLAFFLGALFSLILIAIRRKKFGQTVPFAPFLVAGFLIALFWGELVLSWYTRALL